MMKSVLLTTVFTGLNYGSSLQAYASKMLLSSMGLKCDIVARKSLMRNRDIRISKFLILLIRPFLIRGKHGKKSLATYHGSYSKKMIGNSALRFENFTKTYLNPNYLSWNELKRLANESVACFAGSDQIWNSSALYVNPLYYLRFAPISKRIALAPSFGRDFVAEYNRKKIGKWISEFSYLSVRESSGISLIKKISGRDAVQLIDPTLMIDAQMWSTSLGLEIKTDNYILAYFLDYPSITALSALKEIKQNMKCKVIGIPYLFDDMTYCDYVVPAGPIDFLNLIKNAKCVITDSFHGTAFSINFHIPFYVFARAYGSASSQNSRLISILKMMNMMHRFEAKSVFSELNNLDFEYSEKQLNAERIKAKEYIRSSLGMA